MIAANVKDSDRVIDILLARGADVNQTSMFFTRRSVLHQDTNPPFTLSR